MMRVRRTYVVIAMALAIVIVATRDTSRAASGYSAYNIRGTYRLTFSGIVLTSGRLQSGVGIFVADGIGHITGTEVFNDGGTVCRDVAVTATYTVGGNGIGSLSADFASPPAGCTPFDPRCGDTKASSADSTSSSPPCSGHFNSSLLVVDGGDIVRAVSTDSTFVTVAEEWRRQAE